MSSRYGSLPRVRYSRAKRAAIVAASASVLTGTALAMPAASYASEVANEPVTGVLDLSAPLDTVPGTGDAEPTTTGPTTTEPAAVGQVTDEQVTDEQVTVEPVPIAQVTVEPVPTAPVPIAPVTAEPVPTAPVPTAPVTVQTVTSGPSTVEPGPVETVTAETVSVQAAPAEPSPAAPATDVQSAPAQGSAQPSTVEPAPSVPTRFDAARPSTKGTVPASAVAPAPQPADRRAEANPVASDTIVREVLEHRAQREMARAPAAERAPIVGAEQSAPALTKDGLALAAPLTDTGPRGVDTVDLLTGKGPDSSMGDWNLMPEVLFAIGPLFLAGAAVAAHGRRNARAAAGHVGVVQRGRHASTH